jgi:peptidoglycan/LPS O-acetylase OafA/YrhL
VFRKPVYSTGLDVTLLAIAAALAIPAIIPGICFTAPLQWFGRMSYEVYLTHMFVVTLGTQWFTAHKIPINYAPVWFAGSLATAGLLGFAVAHWYSEPLNRKLREKRLLPDPVNV